MTIKIFTIPLFIFFSLSSDAQFHTTEIYHNGKQKFILIDSILSLNKLDNKYNSSNNVSLPRYTYRSGIISNDGTKIINKSGGYLTGSYYTVGDNLFIDLRLVESGTSKKYYLEAHVNKKKNILEIFEGNHVRDNEINKLQKEMKLTCKELPRDVYKGSYINMLSNNLFDQDLDLKNYKPRYRKIEGNILDDSRMNDNNATDLQYVGLVLEIMSGYYLTLEESYKYQEGYYQNEDDLTSYINLMRKIPGHYYFFDNLNEVEQSVVPKFFERRIKDVNSLVSVENYTKFLERKGLLSEIVLNDLKKCRYKLQLEEKQGSVMFAEVSPLNNFYYNPKNQEIIKREWGEESDIFIDFNIVKDVWITLHTHKGLNENMYYYTKGVTLRNGIMQPIEFGTMDILYLDLYLNGGGKFWDYKNKNKLEKGIVVEFEAISKKESNSSKSEYFSSYYSMLEYENGRLRYDLMEGDYFNNKVKYDRQRDKIIPENLNTIINENKNYDKSRLPRCVLVYDQILEPRYIRDFRPPPRHGWLSSDGDRNYKGSCDQIHQYVDNIIQNSLKLYLTSELYYLNENIYSQDFDHIDYEEMNIRIGAKNSVEKGIDDLTIPSFNYYEATEKLSFGKIMNEIREEFQSIQNSTRIEQTYSHNNDLDFDLDKGLKLLDNLGKGLEAIDRISSAYEKLFPDNKSDKNQETKGEEENSKNVSNTNFTVDWTNKEKGNFNDVRIIVQQLADDFVASCPLNQRHSTSYSIKDWSVANNSHICVAYIIDVEISWIEKGGFLSDKMKSASGILFYLCDKNIPLFYLYEKDFFHEMFGVGGCLNKMSSEKKEEYGNWFSKELTQWEFIGDQIYWR